MTWIDGLLILFFLVSIGVGARMGSLWTGACLVGGFVGAFLADMYTAPFSGFVGGFAGNETVAAVLLFVLGCAVVIIPGWLLSRIISGIFLGFIDGAFGFLVGGVASLCATALVLLLVIPMLPRIEKTSTWKKSAIARPLQNALENVFYSDRFQKPSRMSPVTKNVGSELKEVATELVHEMKKSK